jgi:hypothetical protein
MAKLTAAQIKEQIKKIQKAIEKEKDAYQGKIFIGLKPEEIERKLNRAKSPIIMFQEIFGTSVTAGGTFPYTVGIWNPDPSDAFFLFAHVWVGSGSVDPVIGTFLLNVDTRFPRLAEPAFPGAVIGPSSFLAFNFALKVPAGVEKTNYFGNTCLIQQASFLDVGVYLDRAVWPFTVT